MAGDWIPYCKDLPRKPEVLTIAEITGRPLAEVILALLELWSWADGQTEDGILRPLFVRSLSAVCPQLDAQFVDALVSVGWIRLESNCMEFVNFDYWMGYSGKRRLKDACRKRHGRKSLTEPSASCPQNVRSACGQNADKLRTTEQNRREEKKNTPLPPKGGGEITLPQALDTPEFRVLWDEWEKHRREIRHALKDTTRNKQLRELERMGVARAVAALEYSMRQGYQGIVEEKGKANGTPHGAMGRPGRVESPPGKYDHLESPTPPVAGTDPVLPEAQGAVRRPDRTAPASGDRPGGPG